MPPFQNTTLGSGIFSFNRNRSLTLLLLIIVLSICSRNSSSIHNNNNNNINMNMNRAITSWVSSSGRNKLQSSIVKSFLQNEKLGPRHKQINFPSRNYRPYKSYLYSSTLSLASNNADLVAERHRIAQEKKLTRRQYLELDRQRNLELKRLIHTSNNVTESGYAIPELYGVKVSVCSYLRKEIRMNGREKRGRVFVPMESEGCTTLKGLKQELHSFFRSLKKQSYVLSASLPEFHWGDEDGSGEASLLAPPAPDMEVEDGGRGALNMHYENNEYWPLESDDDVIKSFERASEFFRLNQSMSVVLKRPTLIIHVSRDPNYVPPPTPAYLVDMPDPSQSETMTMISFYSFPSQGIDDEEEFALRLKQLWKPFGVLGRVYVAKEGVNAQMSIPTNVLENFRECCMNYITQLGEFMENGINVDPVPLSMEEFKTAGDDGKNPPFTNLHVRVRDQIVADGLDKELNWQSAGYDMPPLEWHAKVKILQEAIEQGTEEEKKKDLPIVLDCRNHYETGVGRFVGAEPLGTKTFRESWDVLKDRLKDTPKNAPIMTYCTGGGLHEVSFCASLHLLATALSD